MADVVVFPKFLTLELAREVVRSVIRRINDPNSAIWSLVTDQQRRDGCSFVINAPCRRDGLLSREVLLWMSHVPEESQWPYPFADIAKNKNEQMVEGRSNGYSIRSHLLFTGDTPYWGGCELEGIVVTCSGFSEKADRAASELIARGLIASAEELWEASDDKKNEVNFLT